MTGSWFHRRFAATSTQSQPPLVQLSVSFCDSLKCPPSHQPITNWISEWDGRGNKSHCVSLGAAVLRRSCAFRAAEVYTGLSIQISHIQIHFSSFSSQRDQRLSRGFALSDQRERKTEGCIRILRLKTPANVNLSKYYNFIYTDHFKLSI